jgi:hypothetical protein
MMTMHSNIMHHDKWNRLGWSTPKLPRAGYMYAVSAVSAKRLGSLVPRANQNSIRCFCLVVQYIVCDLSHPIHMETNGATCGSELHTLHL